MRFSRNQFLVLFALKFLFFVEGTFAQTSTYRSTVDEGLTIKNVSIAPLVDNVNGIYSNPLTTALKDYLNDEKYWTYRDSSESGPVRPEDLDDSPEKVKAILKKSGQSDALIAGRITKGPNGVTVKLNLYLKSDGFLASQETLSDFSGFEISDLKFQVTALFERLRKNLPYFGVILSRKGQLVTFNLGSKSGIKEGDPISVIQILKLQRHPKFKFVVGSEKEIIGRIKVSKVEDALSFGVIELEREPSAVQPNMKLLPVNFVKYPNATTQDGKMIQELNDRKDAPVAFGDSPNEWLPKRPPTFGKVGFLFGLGTYSISNTVSTAGGVEDNKTFVPSMHLRGEMWLTQTWQLGLNLKQYVFSAANTMNGSGPSSINVSGLQTDLNVGYNFLMTDTFFGPKLQVSLGYSKYAATVSDSTPTAYTSTSFSGFNLGLGGAFPVDEKQNINIGGKLNYYLFPSVDESPVTSGSSSSATISGFTVFGDYRWTESLHLAGEVMYESFSASFNGTGTRTPSASAAAHNLFTLAFGVNYYF